MLSTFASFGTSIKSNLPLNNRLLNPLQTIQPVVRRGYTLAPPGPLDGGLLVPPPALGIPLRCRAMRFGDRKKGGHSPGADAQNRRRGSTGPVGSDIHMPCTRMRSQQASGVKKGHLKHQSTNQQNTTVIRTRCRFYRPTYSFDTRLRVSRLQESEKLYKPFIHGVRSSQKRLALSWSTVHVFHRMSVHGTDVRQEGRSHDRPSHDRGDPVLCKPT